MIINHKQPQPPPINKPIPNRPISPPPPPIKYQQQVIIIKHEDS